MRGLSIVAASRVYAPAAMHGLLVAVASLAPVGSVVVAPGLSCLVTRGIFSDQGPGWGPLHWQADS